MARHTASQDGKVKAGRERRETTRHAIQIPIEMAQGKSMAIHVTEDLSARGAFFGKAIPYDVGVLVRLRIVLPGDPAPIVCQGEIVNIPDRKSFGMGVKFAGLSEEDEARIDRFASRNG
jgi:hypothetical protein